MVVPKAVTLPMLILVYARVQGILEGLLNGLIQVAKTMRQASGPRVLATRSKIFGEN